MEAGPGALGPGRVALAACGTAVHVTIALAIADAYRHSFPGCDLLFLGSAAGIEALLRPR